MQAITGTPAGTFPGPAYRPRSKRADRNRRPAVEARAAAPGIDRSGFLNQALPVRYGPSGELDRDIAAMLTERNYRCLQSAAAHYASLLGRSLDCPGGDAPLRERLCLLYLAFRAILPQDQELNIEHRDSIETDNSYAKELVWVIYAENRWPELRFFWLPVAFVDKLKGRFRRIAVTFLHRFAKNNRLHSIREGFDYEMLTDFLPERIAECDQDDEYREMGFRALEDYGDGRVKALFDEIRRCPQPVNLDRELKFYRPRSAMERELLDLFRSGREFLSGDSIMNYEYFYDNPELEWGDCDAEIIGMDRSIQLIYHSKDFMTTEIEEMVNHSIQYGAEILTPVTYLILQPDTERVFQKSDYPERFCDWFAEAFETITDYE